MGSVWWALVSPFVVLPVGVLAFGVLVWCDRHLTEDGDIFVSRIITVVGQAIFAYTLSVCIISQLASKYFDTAPTFGRLIDEGIGGERISWLLIFVVAESLIKIWREFHDKKPKDLTMKNPRNGKQ
jgi:hypothetical protein